MNAGKTIDIISNNEDTVPQDKPKTEDATPWKGLLIALCSTFMSGIALMLATFIAAASVLLLGFLIDTLRRAFFGKGLSTAVSAVGISLSLLGICGGAFLMAKPDVVSSKSKK